MKKDCYLHLEHLPPLGYEYVNEALNATYAVTKPSTEMPDVVHKQNRWIGSENAPSTFYKTKFCKDLEAEFGNIETYYVRFNTMSLYDWHTDIQRQCGINFLIQPVSDALTLFRYAELSDHTLMYHLEKLEYVARMPVLFNPTVEHCVINLSNKPRYLLSVSFPRTITFYHVREFLKNYTTDAY